MLYERSCSMKGTAQGTNFDNMLATILLAKILMPLLCTVWHACFWHCNYIGKLGNILMKKCNIGMLCQSDYFANILGKYFFRVYGECSANCFSTNIFTHSKLHQHVWLILINLLANMLDQFVPVQWLAFMIRIIKVYLSTI